MHTLLRHIAGFLAAGAAANILVTWACVLAGSRRWCPDMDAVAGGTWDARRAAARPPADWPLGGLPDPDRVWPVPVPAAWPHPSYRYIVGWPGLRMDVGLSYYWGRKTGWGYGAAVVDAGWPCRSLRWNVFQEDEPPPTLGLVPVAPTSPRPLGFRPTDSLWRSGLPIPGAGTATAGWLSRPAWVRLPVRPVWAGFAADSMAWGAGLLGLVRGPETVRAAIRRRRGLCPACGYPIGVSPVCTECGGTISGGTRAAANRGKGAEAATTRGAHGPPDGQG